jgi:hypothetical protein
MNRTNERAAWVFLAALMLMAALLLAGCQSQSPLAQSVAARELYTSTLEVLVVARQAGAISDDTATELEPWRAATAAAIDAMEQAALEQDASAFRSAQAAYNTAIDKLLEWRIRSRQ